MNIGVGAVCLATAVAGWGQTTGRAAAIEVPGVVLDSEGKALSGARVRAIRLGPVMHTTAPVLADAAGAFQIAVPDAGEYVFCASQNPRRMGANPQVDPCFYLEKGAPVVTIGSGAAAKQVTVRMTEGRRLSVFVRDQEALLRTPTEAKVPVTPGTAKALLVHLVGPPGATPRPLIASRPDGDGQRFEIVIPATSSNRLRIQTTGLTLRDAANRTAAAGRFEEPIVLPEKGKRAELEYSVGRP